MFCNVVFGIDNVFVFNTKAPSSLKSLVNNCVEEKVFDPLID
jgi:hypothetical protein